MERYMYLHLTLFCLFPSGMTIPSYPVALHTLTHHVCVCGYSSRYSSSCLRFTVFINLVAASWAWCSPGQLCWNQANNQTRAFSPIAKWQMVQPSLFPALISHCDIPFGLFLAQSSSPSWYFEAVNNHIWTRRCSWEGLLPLTTWSLADSLMLPSVQASMSLIIQNKTF